MKRVLKSSQSLKTAQKFGYGESKFKNYEDWPSNYTDEDGRFWVKLPESLGMSEFIATGMMLVEYHTYDSETDHRLYIDAKGQVWNEYVEGIL